MATLSDMKVTFDQPEAVEYEIVAGDAGACWNAVNRLLKQGWKLYGPLAVSALGYGDGLAKHSSREGMLADDTPDLKPPGRVHKPKPGDTNPNDMLEEE